MAADKKIRFYHGASTDIDAKIEDGTINESDFIVGSDNDTLYYVDETKTVKALGSAKTKESITVNTGGSAVGGIKDGQVIDAGTSLDDFIKKLLLKQVPATYTKPGVTIAVASGNGAGDYEVGTNISTTLKAIFTQNDAGALTSLGIFKSGQSDAIISGAESPVTSEAQEFVIPDGNVIFTATAAYGEGAIKQDNLGNDSPSGHIEAGSVTSNQLWFSGKRNLFYGTGVGSVPELTSEVVRGLSKSTLNPKNGQTFDVSVAVGQQYVIIAYPKTLRSMTKCFYVEQNTDLVANFIESTLSVQGANGAAGADYRVYTYGMSVPSAATMTLQVQI